jgi:hypothetical protein
MTTTAAGIAAFTPAVLVAIDKVETRFDQAIKDLREKAAALVNAAAIETGGGPAGAGVAATDLNTVFSDLITDLSSADYLLFDSGTSIGLLSA